MFRYYTTQRPPTAFAVPNKPDNRVKAVLAFKQRRYAPSILREAWGYVEYGKPLSYNEMDDYELAEAGPFYKDKQTGEIVSHQLMLHKYATDYDGEDPSNVCGWDEYFTRIKGGYR